MQARIAIIFAQFGPYHHARVSALQTQCECDVIPIQIAEGTTTYAWDSSNAQACKGLISLCKGSYESVSAFQVFNRSRSFFREQKVTHALLPSYAPAAETAILLAAKSWGVRCIMMNESHAGTEQATGLRRWIKKRLIALFEAGLVGGTPQVRHFDALGIPKHRLFTGYDAIDNVYFSQAAVDARRNAEQLRTKYDLPEHYFLSLGRMVEKKNLQGLIKAYASFAEKLKTQAEDQVLPALVFVGSGPKESSLRELCTQLGLKIVDHSPRPSTSRPLDPRPSPSVHFYGFRQIEENPIFFALAEAFILPSLWEEWGLVVNEAMACGLPVLVSNTVGSAEDLVDHGKNGYTFPPESPEALATCLESIHNDGDLRKSMGQHSLDIIANWGCDNFARNAIAAVESTKVTFQGHG